MIKSMKKDPFVLLTTRPYANENQILLPPYDCLSSGWVKSRELSFNRETDVASSGLMLI